MPLDARRLDETRLDTSGLDASTLKAKGTMWQRTGRLRTECKETGGHDNAYEQSGCKKLDATGCEQAKFKETGCKRTGCEQRGSNKMRHEVTGSEQIGCTETRRKDTDREPTG